MKNKEIQTITIILEMIDLVQAKPIITKSLSASKAIMERKRV
jgi:hypothetical protein